MGWLVIILFNISFVIITSGLICLFGWFNITRHWILTQVFICYISFHILIFTCNNFFYDEIQSCPNIFFIHFKDKYLSRFATEYTNVTRSNISRLHFLN